MSAISRRVDCKVLFIECANKALFVICHESVAVLKEYNIRHHYQSKHQGTYSRFEGNIREEKLEKLKQSINSQRSIFTKASKQNESITGLVLKWLIFSLKMASLLQMVR